MEQWRVIEELDRMREWDADALCDSLNITTEELLEIPWVLPRALTWIEENIGE